MKLYEPDLVFTTEVIICTIKRRGDGKDDPIRVITQVFTKDGRIVAEYDPLDDFNISEKNETTP